ncbi:unnamed protein product [Ostreobium quekettii]|uniref:Uncharacterized protein n=1 Tax=Ostreobium quekettii TaxID=121088 RepID=A0A8S1J4U8_9CHLO|nr:unnamed protein product [Ostreobium quekettii]|eukprot:evm.model.scf_207EXC.2 EVM.evm.TU.scf_207EXC.2   scf_207EXC:41247-43333(-)
MAMTSISRPCPMVAGVAGPLLRRLPRPTSHRCSRVMASAAEHAQKFPPEFPNAILPPSPGCGFMKAPPKQSLVDAGMAHTAKAWVLNSVEFVHWLSFVPGIAVAWMMFQYMGAIAAVQVLGKQIGTLGVFIMMIGHLTQVYGAGLCGNMNHDYEGWQVAPFRSPLPIPNQDNPPQHATSFNNGWLRTVTYHYLLGTYTMGMALFSAAALAFRPAALACAGLTAAVVFLAPKQPLITRKDGEVPVLPISKWMFGILGANAVLNLACIGLIFSPRLLHLVTPYIGSDLLAKVLAGALGAGPLLFFAAAGVLEGVKAEGTFNQYWHLAAFVSVNVGFVLMALLYKYVFGC